MMDIDDQIASEMSVKHVCDNGKRKNGNPNKNAIRRAKAGSPEFKLEFNRPYGHQIDRFRDRYGIAIDADQVRGMTHMIRNGMHMAERIKDNGRLVVVFKLGDVLIAAGYDKASRNIHTFLDRSEALRTLTRGRAPVRI